MATDVFPFEVWPEGILQARIPANDNSLRNEVLSKAALTIANSSPGSPSDGDVHIVGTAWGGFSADDVAIYKGGSWQAFAPFPGWVKWLSSASALYTYTGSVWVEFTGSGGAGDVVGPNSSTDANIVLFDGATGKLLKDAGEGIASVRRIPQNSQSAAYTLVLADAGKHILHPSADTTARTYTIPANLSVAYPAGTAITFVNQNGAGAVTIAITSDTMRLAGSGATGSRTLAANGIATALKITATEWIISGTGLS